MTRPRAPADRRAAIAWLAIFGLFLQLAAAALHVPGMPRGDGLDAAPICHQLIANETDGVGKGSGGDPDQPAHDGCPFCALHVHLGLVGASPPVSAGPVAIVAAQPAPPPFAAAPLSRRPTDAAPRGPPLAG